MNVQEAYKKATEIADMLGIEVITLNEDGSTTTQTPKQEGNKAIDMLDIVRVIMK